MPETTRTKTPTDCRDWRCSRCFKLLGRRDDGKVHVHFHRGHQYVMSIPVSAVCRGCGSLNTL